MDRSGIVSALDIFTIGIGPSSSHTVGPMRAAARFVRRLERDGQIEAVQAVSVQLYGSLGLTGKGHGSDKAVILGLQGHAPESVDPDAIASVVDGVCSSRTVVLPDGHEVAFDPATALVFDQTTTLPFHPNGMRFTATDRDGANLAQRTYYSVGGGFVVPERRDADPDIAASADAPRRPCDFATADDLLRMASDRGDPISAVMAANEDSWRPRAETRRRLLEVWDAMQRCMARGFQSKGVLPGGFEVERRAPALYRKLGEGNARGTGLDVMEAMDWVNLYALAVNEENAAGGRVVTAPTNGAAGVVPAVLQYYVTFCPGADEARVMAFLLAAAALANLYRKNASLSGADVGCQGEVGVACSMAAGALTEVLGGSAGQVENAAEIGMEHNLGLTCDPVGGLVQIPCIERNAMGAVKAINASRLALQGDGSHRVSLDAVIETMRQTGSDMKSKYKETSRGGLAVNVVEC
ncbi:MAG: L-serine ammonia-lyase [Vicinamibacterales bacterium]|nr:L-serine ammonia-lyase [Vicinamibacterales bacterium]